MKSVQDRGGAGHLPSRRTHGPAERCHRVTHDQAPAPAGRQGQLRRAGAHGRGRGLRAPAAAGTRGRPAPRVGRGRGGHGPLGRRARPPVRGPGEPALGVRPRPGRRRHRRRPAAAADHPRRPGRPGGGRRRGDLARGAGRHPAAGARPARAPRPPRPVGRRHRGRRRRRRQDLAVRGGGRHPPGAAGRHRTGRADRLLTRPQPAAVRRRAGRARAGGGGHRGDAPARPGARAGPPVPAVLPWPGGHAGRPAAADRRAPVRGRAGLGAGQPGRGLDVPARPGQGARREPAGRHRAAGRPGRRPGAGGAGHPGLPRLPGPAGRAGAGRCGPTASGGSRIHG